MSAPLSDALRARFQKLVKEGLSGRAAAMRLKLSPATGGRAHLNTIGKFLRKLGYSHKKFAGRRRTKVRKQRREDWFRHRIPAVSA